MSDPLLFAAVDEQGWSWKPGDPYLAAYILTGYYLLLAAMSFWLCRRIRLQERQVVTESSEISSLKRRYYLWMMIALVVLLLGINKQLDLQSLIPYLGRLVFLKLGIYGIRRPVQAIFFVAIFFVSVVGLALVFRRVRIPSRPALLAWLGLFLQCGFVLFRAATINHLEWRLWTAIRAHSLNIVIETIGLVVINAALVWEYFELRRSSEGG